MRRRPPPPHPAGEDLFGAPAARPPAPPPPPPPRAAYRVAPPEVAPPARAAEPPIEESFPGASAASAITISTLTQTARDVIEGAFMPLWVRGEVSDFKSHRNGHWYFCLRDGRTQIRCVVWASEQWRIPAPPDEGMQVAALGQLTVYAARGDMQFAIRGMDAQGDGLWRKALERTRARLEADGLLAIGRKRAIPRFPRRIAVITSLSGAALHDIIAVARRRSPQVEIVVVAAIVQGEGAPDALVKAIERVTRWRGADTLIIGRGGGGREDLWAFNDERVARALAACPIPTISAVGHEVDVTICDLVADARAATPSAAAEAAVPLRSHLVSHLRARANALSGAATRRIDDARARLGRARADARLHAERHTERRRARVDRAAGRLHALSPLATLGRGYAVALGDDGATLSSVGQFAANRRFTLRLRDGSVRARSESVAPPSAAGES